MYVYIGLQLLEEIEDLKKTIARLTEDLNTALHSGTQLEVGSRSIDGTAGGG